MTQYISNSKILEQDSELRHNLSMHSHENQARIYEQEIELTVCNYEQLLEMERKNSAEKSEFLLYLIQSTYLKHTQEIEALKEQLEAAMAEKEEAKTLEQQMQTIGEGVDSIVQEGQRLKSQNETLLRYLDEQYAHERELDEYIEATYEELDKYNQKIDTWEREKIRWNRRKKEMIEIIEYVERYVNPKALHTIDSY